MGLSPKCMFAQAFLQCTFLAAANSIAVSMFHCAVQTLLDPFQHRCTKLFRGLHAEPRNCNTWTRPLNCWNCCSSYNAESHPLNPGVGKELPAPQLLTKASTGTWKGRVTVGEAGLVQVICQRVHLQQVLPLSLFVECKQVTNTSYRAPT